MTVTGAIDAGDLGVTLMHEHLINDCTSCWNPPAPDDLTGQEIAAGPVRMSYLGRLRNDPFLSLDNCRLDDVGLVSAELARFAEAGGASVVEQTCSGIGRDPGALARIARNTGLNIIMGCGFYLEASHPAQVRGMTAVDVADHLEQEISEGVNGVRPGIIGEIGVSAAFTQEEEKVLRGAAIAQRRTGLPLSIHLPGWERHGGRVLDVVAEEGASLEATVLCHLNPSMRDVDYQHDLADRGAWIEYDMVGLEFYFADQAAQSPSDEDNARAIVELVRAGYAGRLLLSSDVFLKTMLVRYGGYGYAHLLTAFAQRLTRHGLTADDLTRLLIRNPAAVFQATVKETTDDQNSRRW
ncbi:phosphotriesterase-related protein [Actinomadura sp. ATCC 31491]|uniref:Phosphotriesterase-related protein n=1 Tax=Actinomadura luzonensis TaxID=2805427 RepID=A0ABT0FKB5_9ACTN|nr:phosphotriesterase-related protein [Actinomadura luzonensis]MCK2212416.1 phosphotriesterase-related protein [Actinomadura luzonensis]